MIKCDICWGDNCKNACGEDFAIAKAMMGKARELIAKYARCHQDCDTEGGGKCICGFLSALRELGEVENDKN